MRTPTRVTRGLAGSLSLLLAAGTLALLAPAARADSAPLTPADPTTPVTVTADPLPTVQIDGVVWSQVVVGDTVYATGSFGTARPAGAKPGSQETVRNNLLAFDIRTGELIRSFAPDLNGQGLAVAASPDGKRLYVGGDFTRADGQVRNRIAAYDTATGQLVAGFRPSVVGQVRALAATNSTVYLGGNFSAVGSVSRTRLAAVSASTGALLPWAPVPGAAATAGSNEVLALVVTGGGSQVVAAGRFATLNGVAAPGVGALDGGSGATRPFAVNTILTNQGANSAVWGLSTDGERVYGSAYDYGGTGNLEGTFIAEAAGGALVSVAYCRGDNYSSHAANGALYIASHMHNCIHTQGFPEQSPKVFKHATAVALVPSGTVSRYTWKNANWRGAPASPVLPWYPSMAMGTFTGQYQSGWSVTGAGRYVVYGGEFPRVNGIGQQGLVRYAMPDVAPNAVGPEPAPAPTAQAIAPGTVRIGWTASVDMDNENLTYRVYRDGGATPVGSFTRPSTWWQTPGLSFTDRGVAAGTHSYRVTVSDPVGNSVESAAVTVTVTGDGAPRAYADLVHADGAIDHWPLGESSGGTAFDQAGTSDMAVGSGVSRGAGGAIAGDGDTAASFGGTTSGYLATGAKVAGPQKFAVEAWFRTTSRKGGVVVGFGNYNTRTSTNHDRKVYLDTTGRVSFGVYDGAAYTVTSPQSYNDGKWHHVVASLGPEGMELHLDGRLASRRTAATWAQVYDGYWRIGGDSPWSGSGWFTGSIDEVAVYPRALTAEQVAAHHTLGSTGTAVNKAPVAAFASAVEGAVASFDGSGSFDADGSVASWAWSFGDGGSGSGVSASHTYAESGTYPVTLTVTDEDGATGSVTRSVTVSVPAPAPPADPSVLASDVFDRTVAGGLGTADVGGEWTVSAGGSRQSVDPGRATFALTKGTNTGSFLGSVAQTDAQLRVTFSLAQAPTGGGAMLYAVSRRVAAGDEYRARVRVRADGSVGLVLVRLSGGQEFFLGGETTVAGLTYTPGTELVLRLQAVGSGTTELTATVWPVGSPEPATPTVTRTDSTPALQAPGAIGITGYLSGSATAPVDVRITRFTGTPVGAAPPAEEPPAAEPPAAEPPANEAPVAAFASAVEGAVASFDGSGSFDADGSVASWAWSFGDGGSGSGVSASHTYAESGTYPVTLTVTDEDGATGSVTRSVTVSVPAPAPPADPSVLASDVFDRTVAGGLGTADVGGEWTVSAGGSRQSVDPGRATFALTKGTNTGSFLGSVAQTDAQLRVTFSLAQAPTGGGAMLYAVSRRVAAGDEYRARVRVRADGSVGLVLVRLSGGQEFFLGGETTVAGLTYTPGTELVLRLQAVGSGTTELTATVWPVGSPEPATPTVTRTDSTPALQAPGAIGITGYLSGSATAPVDVRITRFSAAPVG